MALKLLLCLERIMNSLFRTVISISDSLKSVRKSVLINDTIIVSGIVINLKNGGTQKRHGRLTKTKLLGIMMKE